VAHFVKREVELRTVAVGVVEQTVLAANSLVGEDAVLLVIENLSGTQTFSGTVWNSPDGSTQWSQETDDSFLSTAPGISRRILLPADRLWVRVLGSFAGAPGSVRLTVIKLREATRRG
jgi:hypothetical protein